MARQLTAEEEFILTLPYDYPYYYRLRKSFEADETCPFCKFHLQRNPKLFENKHWIVTKNAFPNSRPLSVMLLIVSRQHWRRLDEITPEGWTDYHEIMQWISQNYDLPGGMLFLRFGDMSYNNGTIRHLHWNLWVPNKTGEVFVSIYKSGESRQADLERTAKFAEMYEAGITP